jgi:2-dehydropantoate 2-reductase
VVFFFVKAHHTASAAQLARPLVGSSTTVVSLQNGWGNADVLADTYSPDQIVMGVTYHSATVIAPGRVAHTGKGATYLGPYVDGSPLDRAAAVGQLLGGAGIEATVTPQVKTEVWKKLILNAATLPTAALTRLSAGDLGQPGPMLDLVDALAAEAVQVARAQGYAIDLAERTERIHAVLTGAGAGKASMLQDVEARRKTEIEVINGAVVRAAEKVGMDIPLNRAMVALIGGLERGWQR